MVAVPETMARAADVGGFGPVVGIATTTMPEPPAPDNIFIVSA
jgi:hypothetical protein